MLEIPLKKWKSLEARRVVLISQGKEILGLDKTTWCETSTGQFILTRLLRSGYGNRSSLNDTLNIQISVMKKQFLALIFFSAEGNSAAEIKLKMSLPLGAQLRSLVGKRVINIFYCFCFPDLHWSSQPTSGRGLEKRHVPAEKAFLSLWFGIFT